MSTWFRVLSHLVLPGVSSLVGATATSEGHAGERGATGGLLRSRGASSPSLILTPPTNEKKRESSTPRGL